MKTVMIKSSHEMIDPRVTREAQILASAGHDVTILAWDREHKYPREEYRDGYRIRRFGFKAAYGPKVLLCLPVWWCFEFVWLMTTSWDVVHALEFDTIVPAIVAGKLKRKPVIYDLSDIYEDMRPLPQVIRVISLCIDKIFMRLASIVVVADQMRIAELDGIPNNNTIVIYSNSPSDFHKQSTAPVRERGIFTIFYVGMLQRNRRLNLDRAIAAIRDIGDVRLIVAGYGDQAREIEDWASETPNKLEFIGQLTYHEVLERTLMADLLIALHDPSVPTNRLGVSNKLYEAMMSAIPILVSKGTATAEVAEKENCGLVIDGNSVEEIKEAILKLKDNPELCQQLGANGRRAYEQRYSWEIGKQRLLALYQKIGKKRETNLQPAGSRN